MRENITIQDPKEKEAISRIEKLNDFKSLRIRKLLNLPDLTRKANSPIKFLTEKVVNLERFKDFDVVEIPKVITVKDNFDILNTPADHPSRKESDTYYLNKDLVLRTHTTAVWSSYLKNSNTIKKLEKSGEVGALSFGTVFRKDEIDRNHFPAFHQIDGLYICKRDKKVITQEDLKAVLVDIAKNLYGKDVEWKFLPDDFPFTYESIEMNVMYKENWLEILGAGLVRDVVLSNLDIDPTVYNGWAFGFGLDRLAMIKMGIPDIRVLWSDDERITSQFKNIDSQYKEVSKYPSTIRDISFIVDKNVSLNNYYEIVRDCAGNLIEEMKLLDTYQDAEKFGKDKVSHTFRIVYRSPERTLTNEEVNTIQDKIRDKTQSELQAVLR